MDPWEQDRLGYRTIGETFTNLIKSIESGKVISIEAGFGRGKNFFRRAWSDHLRKSGEVVVEIDVQQSDHSGDPVVTLLGALVDAMPKQDGSRAKMAMESAKKLGAISARTVAKIVLRTGADEIIDAVTETAIDKLDSFETLDSIISQLGEGMSKAAGQFITAQMAAEKVRKEELPHQLEALHAALTPDRVQKRVIIILDELDRCHPEYAISVLEAMKLIFNKSGFVFCLMVNADYLEKLAQHRFGAVSGDERYLDKFVDIRLKLEPKESFIKSAVFELASELPLKLPFGDSEEFSINYTAELASTLAIRSGLSMRKIKRIILKVEIALRCYSHFRLDAPLLVFMAFNDEVGNTIETDFLPRSFLTPDEGERQVKRFEKRDLRDLGSDTRVANEISSFIRKTAPELLRLPRDCYNLPDSQDYVDWALVFKFLAPNYIPLHRSVLDAIASVSVQIE